MLNDLITAEGAGLRPDETPWNVYPRPQMRRDNYVNLNGWWDYAVTEQNVQPSTYCERIRVPFCPESALSGVRKHPKDGAFIWYRRNFDRPNARQDGRILLHFGAVDQTARIYVNRSEVFYHEGGYDSFSVDITDYLSETNTLTVCCTDDLKDLSFPYGKQDLQRGGMWYTPTSGIWQTVWLECVPDRHIQHLIIENRGFSVKITTEPPMEGTIKVANLGEFPLGATITPENPRLWSPEDPYLYDFSVETDCDRVESYFAIRSLEIKSDGKFNRLCLNGKPYFFHGLLDQGYWPESLLTAPAPESYEKDILTAKNLGFNMLRKHIKVEPEQFYYDCDRLGMVVFQDMVNNGHYSFLRDTALPTVGLQNLCDKRAHKDPKTRVRFLEAMERTVKQLKNHPSICYWTIFNEGWGQFDSDNVYEIFKKLDDTRFIDSTSGWFRRKKTDVDSRHVYFKPVRLKAGEKPLVLSEFGGYTYKVDGHIFNEDETYGYGKYENPDAFSAAVEKLYLERIVPAYLSGLCAAVYTQISDVEDEINGIMTYDREVTKLDEKRMRFIADCFK